MERADAKHIDEIPTKAYADYIFPNITDVSIPFIFTQYITPTKVLPGLHS